MTILTIRKSLQEYIRFADEKKVKALFTIIEDDIKKKQKLWANNEFMTEMEQRSFEMETNKTEGIKWENVQKKAKSVLKK
jgi:hypothetical protein